MATVDMTVASAAGHASALASRLPYLVEFEVTGAAAATAKGSILANADILQIMDIPAESLVLAAGAEVTTADTQGSPDVLMDLGYGSNVDVFVDGAAPTSTGYLAAGTNGVVNFANGARYTSADTLDIVMGQASSFSSADDWVLRVYMVMLDIAGLPAGGAAVDVS